jgi:hypothetical protein
MMSAHTTGTLLLLATVATLGAPRLASACVLRPMVLHHSDTKQAQFDSEAPSRPVIVAADTTRRSGLTCGQELCVENNCGDLGMVSIKLAPGQDDLTLPHQLGYRIELVRGNVPESMRSLIGVALAGPAPLLLRPSFDEVPSLSATLQVVAVDAAGNESTPSEPFTLAWSGCTLSATGDGCESDYDADSELTVGIEAPLLEEALFGDSPMEALGDAQVHVAIAPEGNSFSGGGCSLRGGVTPGSSGSAAAASPWGVAAALATLLGLGVSRRRRR